MALAVLANDSQSGKPAAMDLEAVTLQLPFAAPATEGSFHAVGARILDAQTWAAAPYARADVDGFVFHPGGKRKGKRTEPPKPWAKRPPSVTTVLATLKPQGDALLEIDSAAGKAAVSLWSIEFDRPKKYLDGTLMVRRLPAPRTSLACRSAYADVQGVQAGLGRLFGDIRAGGHCLHRNQGALVGAGVRMVSAGGTRKGSHPARRICQPPPSAR